MLLVTILAGCTVPVADEPDTPEDPLPAWDAWSAPIVIDCDAICYEVSVSADPDGNIYATNVGGSIFVRHGSNNTTTALALPAWPEAAYPTGWRGDTQLYTDPAGRLWFVALLTSRLSQDALHRDLQVGRSDDQGVTWALNLRYGPADAVGAISPSFADRPWLAFADNGDVYMSWFDGPYAPSASLYPGIFDVWATRSIDDGQTWQTPAQVWAHADAQEGALAGQPIVARDGRFLIPLHVFPNNANSQGTRSTLVAASSDGATTFELLTVDAQVGANRFPMLHEDDQGSLHYARQSAGALTVQSSHDGGATWSEPVVFTTDGQRMRASPWIVDDYSGNVTVFWFSAVADGVEARLHATRWASGQDANNATTSSVMQVTGGAGIQAPNTDLAAATVLPDGRIVAAVGDRETGQLQLVVGRSANDAASMPDPEP